MRTRGLLGEEHILRGENRCVEDGFKDKGLSSQGKHYAQYFYIRLLSGQMPKDSCLSPRTRRLLKKRVKLK